MRIGVIATAALSAFVLGAHAEDKDVVIGNFHKVEVTIEGLGKLPSIVSADAGKLTIPLEEKNGKPVPGEPVWGDVVIEFEGGAAPVQGWLSNKAPRELKITVDDAYAYRAVGCKPKSASSKDGNTILCCSTNRVIIDTMDLSLLDSKLLPRLEDVEFDGKKVPTRAVSGGKKGKNGDISPLAFEMYDSIPRVQLVEEWLLELDENGVIKVKIVLRTKEQETWDYGDCLLNSMDFAPIRPMSEDEIVHYHSLRYWKPTRLTVS